MSNSRRLIRSFRLSTRSSLLLVLLIAAVGGLWWRWEPWVYARTVHGPNAVSPDGSVYIVISDDNVLAVHDTATGRRIKALGGGVSGEPRLTNDGHHVFIERERMLMVFSIESGNFWKLSLDFSPFTWIKSSCIRSAWVQGQVALLDCVVALVAWDMSSGKLLFHLHRTSLGGLFELSRRTPDQQDFLRSKLLKASTLVELAKCEQDVSCGIGVASFEVEASGRCISTQLHGEDGKQWWDGRTFGRLPDNMDVSIPMKQSTVAPDPGLAVVLSLEKILQIRDAKSGQIIQTLNTAAIPVREGTARLEFFGYGPDLPATVSARNGAIYLWNPERSFVWTMRRPPNWWGIAWLAEFWLTVVFGCGLVWSVCRDWTELGFSMHRELKKREKQW